MEIKQMPFNVLTFRELNEIVNFTWPEWYGKFDCVSQFGWSNDTDHVVLDVQRLPSIPRSKMDKFDQFKWDVWIQWVNGKQPHAVGLYSLLESLCTSTLSVPPGHYVIRVSW